MTRTIRSFILTFLLIVLVACSETNPPSELVSVTPSISASEIISTSEMTTSTLTPLPLPTSILLPTSTVSPSPTAWLSPTPLPFRMDQPYMFDKENGWATGMERGVQQLLVTLEGGKNWESIPTVASFSRAVYAWDVDTFLTIHSLPSSSSSTEREVTSYFSDDRGNSWQNGETITLDFGTDFVLEQLYFLDKNHGWLLGRVNLGHSFQNGTVLFETKDRGMHWEKIYDDAKDTGTKGYDAAAVVLWPILYPFQTQQLMFLNDTVGYFAGDTLMTTNDGGRSWEQKIIARPIDAPPTENPCCSQFVSLPQFVTSTDGVLIQQLYEELPDLINRVYQIPDATYLQYTSDGGQTWEPKPAPAKMGSVYFLDKNIGWYLGKDDLDPNTLTRIYQTTDGGTTWTDFENDLPIPLGSEIRFVDDQNGFTFYTWEKASEYSKFDAQTSLSAYLYSSHDSGDSWQRLEPQINP